MKIYLNKNEIIIGVYYLHHRNSHYSEYPWKTAYPNSSPYYVMFYAILSTEINSDNIEKMPWSEYKETGIEHKLVLELKNKGFYWG